MSVSSEVSPALYEKSNSFFEKLKVGQKFHLKNKKNEDIPSRFIEIVTKGKIDTSFGSEYFPNLEVKINYIMENGKIFNDVDASLTYNLGINPWSHIGVTFEPLGSVTVHANNSSINLLIPNMKLGSEIY